MLSAASRRVRHALCEARQTLLDILEGAKEIVPDRVGKLPPGPGRGDFAGLGGDRGEDEGQGLRDGREIECNIGARFAARVDG